ncbi:MULTISPECIES: response regulator [Calothrix]|uniref:histidine kinase n=2 Tax=Calothrix TaxID=1186 RepID=A0ABR8AAR0_9CYAN|nr:MULTISPECIES: response regulator [Calothrix]MBD2197090.1 response regulator [Calothrix parietina FACHB-288]MBD2225689.1 response regulator [Calothrix anomala FACHB-343]
MSKHQRTVLIVDDSPEDREFYRRCLFRDRDYTYNILEATLGQKGLELWQQHQPDVVLLDYRLPDLDGLEFIARLHPPSSENYLPVIVVTGQGSEAIAVQTMKAGAQDYLVKDQITPDRLILAVNSAISRVQLQSQLQLRIEKDRLVSQITQRIHQSLEIEEILQTTVDEVREFLKSDRVLIFRLQSDGSGIVTTESVAADWTPLLSTSHYDPCLSENYIQPFRQGLVTIKPDIYDGSIDPCHVNLLANLQVRANLVVPILQDGQLWGMLIAHHCQAPRQWQSLEVSLLRELATHLGIALRQAELYQQAQHELGERRRAEALLQEANESLEQRVAERTGELATVNAQLQQELVERQRTQQILEEQAQLLYLAHDTIMTRDLDGRITFWNKGAERMYGWTASEASGQISHELLQTQFPRSLAEVEAELFAQGFWEGELIQVHRNNTPIIVASRWVLQRDEQGNSVKILEINHDITERKRAEEQLRRSSERISLANAELARAARLKDEFLASMSHELRTPLNSILGMAELLLEEVFGSLTAQQRQFLHTVEQSGQHLLELINDILDLSKIESGKMEMKLTSVSVHPLCESSLNFVKQQARHKQIQLTCDIEESVSEIEADERRLLQVLVNLLANAVKFTPDGGSVNLEVRMNFLEQAVEFRVRDTGIGIAAADMGKLFQPFVQLDSSLSRRYPGTGLGLSLVRRIVDLHGGSIRVESQLGKGSCFIVILPWHPLLTQDELPLLSDLGMLQDISMQQALVVEDSTAAASQIKHYLAEMGATSVIHPVGEGALQLALRVKPDVIVLDVYLPDCSGWEVLAKLKGHSETQHIPVIIISVVDQRSRSLELGAVEHILKPLSRQKFYQALSQIFANVQEPNLHTALVIAAMESSQKPSILLAEDNEANITTTMSYLEAHNFRVILARNGVEAVQMAKRHQPNLILMDIQMPEMDGLEAIRQIRAYTPMQAIPIIALTALAMPGDEQLCLEAGANKYLAKPVRLKHLLEMMNQLL